MKFKHALLGGTFDHLHEGHKHFLKAAFKNSSHVTIGLTTQNLTKHKKFPLSIEEYARRKEGLENFLKEGALLKRARVIKIRDPYGTSVSDRNAEVIFVTSHGLKNAKVINLKRQENGLPLLYIYKVNYLRGKDNKIISSTRIREGLIDRLGNPYIDVFKKNLTLPGALRAQARHTPRGDLIKKQTDLRKIVSKAKFVIAVGDIISQNLLEMGVQADISIIDFRNKKQDFQNIPFENKETFVAQNEHHKINRQAVLTYLKLTKIHGKKVLKINGEEDLLTLAVVLLSPLNSLVLYGMPEKGGVVVLVTEEKKQEVLSLLKKFKVN